MAQATFQGPVRSLGGVYTQGPANIIAVSTATLTLDPATHAGRILNITAATTTITLPTINASSNPVQSGPGQDPNTLNNLSALYTFVLSTTATAVKVIGATATDYLLGSVDLSTAGGAASCFTAPLASTFRSINLNGTTTGGIAGTTFSIYALAAGTYFVQGQLIGSGTLATPFATS
jgi:hypothetical protein